MQGAVKKLDSSSTNTERIGGTCKIVEEFFRTLGIILYTRYVNTSNENDIAFTAEILNLLANYFEKPTFDSWQRLCKNCIEELLKRNDKFAIECNYVIEQNVNDQNKAKAIMKEIHRVISHSSFSPPRRTSYLNFLDAIRLLRNFISHQWFSNDLFKGMLDLGIDNFVVSLIQNIFSQFSLSVVKPTKCLSTGEIIAIKYTYTKNQILLPKSDSTVEPTHVYIFYYDNEPQFKFKCTLVRSPVESDQLYVYSKFQNKSAFFESIDVNGGLDIKKWKEENVANIFGISYKRLEKYRRTNDALLLPFDRYVKRKEVAPVLNQYQGFFGRKQEMHQLYRFLNDENKRIMNVVGEGGVGKTRLVLEFVRKMENTEINGWTFAFIHPYVDFDVLSLDRKTLLILDDASKHKDLDKIIDYVINAPSELDLKLIAINRSIYRTSLENRAKQKNTLPLTIEVKNGEIASFLRENFPTINEDITKRIEDESRGVFIVAAIIAEKFINGSINENLLDTVRCKISTYLEDISNKTGIHDDRVAFGVYLLSMIEPVNWNTEKEYMYEELSEQECNALSKIIDYASYDYKDNIFALDDNLILNIKSDVLADFIRLDAFENIRAMDSFMKLLPHFPHRISYNVSSVGKINEASKKSSNKLLGEIWKYLNISNSSTREYILALIFFTRNLSYFKSIIDVSLANVEKWLENCSNIISVHKDNDMAVLLSMAICSIIDYSIDNKLAIEIERFLNGIRKLYQLYDGPEIGEYFSVCLMLMFKYYQNTDQLSKLERYIDEIRHIYYKYPTYDIAFHFVGATTSLYLLYAKTRKYDKMESCSEEIWHIYERHPRKEFGIELDFYLHTMYLACVYSGIRNDTRKMEMWLDRLKQTYTKYQEHRVMLTLARTLSAVCYDYSSASRFEKAEGHLNYLLQLYYANPTLQVAILLAEPLHFAVAYFGDTNQVFKMNNNYDELKNFYRKYPEEAKIREQLSMSCILRVKLQA